MSLVWYSVDNDSYALQQPPLLVLVTSMDMLSD